ncbi:helix-turn-helix domain-containing protein [Paludibacter jiangxiensis]|uniref:AraC-type DNA-binding protein n=1 Tax=Paludibacter jiangxiensis TaxID=681398 RepID=A0A170YS73_9BACT|nr:helix-turn-helix domain-containing protein [Paludibacter jiangxiensis]GAT62021.1 AraC-type DNA-binding protein [Paludibacter jiangxiensis]
MAKKEEIDKQIFIISENDIVFSNDIYDAMSDKHLDTCLHLVVISGNVTFRIGIKSFAAGKDDCIIIPNRTSITDIRATDDFRMTGVIVSNKFMHVALPKSNYEATGLLAMANNPVMPLSVEESERIISDFKQVKFRYNGFSHVYYAEMVVRAVEMMVLDMYDIHSGYHADDLKGMDQSAWILRKFVHLLQKGLYRKYRKVEYYASLLNVSPQYLSECCIRANGHNASFFIERFTAEEIAGLLKREDLSIAEVAYQLDFDTTSYFTRYVKRVLGMTPSEYKARFNVKK